MEAVSAKHSVVVVAVLAALIRSPTGKKSEKSWPRALNERRSRIRYASLVERSVFLVSACKVAVTNVQGSGVTEWVGVSGGGGNTVKDTSRKNALWA